MFDWQYAEKADFSFYFSYETWKIRNGTVNYNKSIKLNGILEINFCNFKLTQYAAYFL